MKFKVKASFVLSLIIIFVLSTFALAEEMNMSKGDEKSIDGIKAELSFKNGKAQTGVGDIMVTLHDSEDKPVIDAEISAVAEMDKDMSMDMKDSKPIDVEFEKGDDEGQYMGTVDFTDQGKWIVKVTIKLNGQEQNVDFDVDVAGNGPNWGVIIGFLVIVAVILVIAAIKKKKPAKA